MLCFLCIFHFVSFIFHYIMSSTSHEINFIYHIDSATNAFLKKLKHRSSFLVKSKQMFEWHQQQLTTRCVLWRTKWIHYMRIMFLHTKHTSINCTNIAQMLAVWTEFTIKLFSHRWVQLKIKADQALTRDMLNTPWLLTNRQFQWTGNSHSQLPLAELGKPSPNIDLLRTTGSNGTA